MATWKFTGKLIVGVAFTVEAEDECEAVDRSQEVVAAALVGDGTVAGLLGLRTLAGGNVDDVCFCADDCYPEGDVEKVEREKD